MKKAKIIFMNLALLAIGIVALVIFDNQELQTRMLIGIYGLIAYLAYLANQRLDEFKKEKFYHCTFEKEVIAADSDKVVARFEVKYKLPFPPYIGLDVGDELNPMPEDCEDEENHDWQSFYTGKIISVFWRYSRFTCKVEPHKMTPENKLEEVIIAYSEHAWKFNGLYFEERRAVRKYLDEELAKLKDTQDEHEKNRYVRLGRVKKKLER